MIVMTGIDFSRSSRSVASFVFDPNNYDHTESSAYNYNRSYLDQLARILVKNIIYISDFEAKLSLIITIIKTFPALLKIIQKEMN